MALITWAWKYWFAFEAQRVLSWPADLRGFGWLSFAIAGSSTIVGLVAALAMLRCKPLRWWMLGLPPALAAFQATVFCLTFTLTVKPIGWWEQFAYFCGEDVLLQLGPVVCVLLLVRAAGYRLVWASGEECRC